MSKDIDWLEKFIAQFNGVTMFPKQRWFTPDKVFSTDNCMSGCRGWTGCEFFHCQFPTKIVKANKLSISELKCWTVVTAIKVWQAGKIMQ